MRKGFNIRLFKSGAEQLCSYLSENSTKAAKSIMLLAIMFLSGISNHIEAQGSKPRIKLGAYYFAGWAGRTPAEYGKFMQSMVDWIEEHPEQTTKEKLAMIYVWNEIGEGGWLVPWKDAFLMHL